MHGFALVRHRLINGGRLIGTSDHDDVFQLQYYQVLYSYPSALPFAPITPEVIGPPLIPFHSDSVLRAYGKIQVP
jgi:hypothetical protein